VARTKRHTIWHTTANPQNAATLRGLARRADAEQEAPLRVTLAEILPALPPCIQMKSGLRLTGIRPFSALIRVDFLRPSGHRRNGRCHEQSTRGGPL